MNEETDCLRKLLPYIHNHEHEMWQLEAIIAQVARVRTCERLKRLTEPLQIFSRRRRRLRLVIIIPFAQLFIGRLTHLKIISAPVLGCTRLSLSSTQLGVEVIWQRWLWVPPRLCTFLSFYFLQVKIKAVALKMTSQVNAPGVYNEWVRKKENYFLESKNRIWTLDWWHVVEHGIRWNKTAAETQKLDQNSFLIMENSFFSSQSTQSECVAPFYFLYSATFLRDTYFKFPSSHRLWM